MLDRCKLNQLYAAFGVAAPGERARLLAGIARVLLRKEVPARAS